MAPVTAPAPKGTPAASTTKVTGAPTATVTTTATKPTPIVTPSAPAKAS